MLYKPNPAHKLVIKAMETEFRYDVNHEDFGM